MSMLCFVNYVAYVSNRTICSRESARNTTRFVQVETQFYTFLDSGMFAEQGYVKGLARFREMVPISQSSIVNRRFFSFFIKIS
jgi:hypothetical protein